MRIRQNINWNTLRQKIYVFFICILLSTSFWFLIVLSKDYTSIIRVPVQYINLPEHIVVVNRIPSQLSLEVNSFGFDLLRYKFVGDENEIILDVNQMLRMTTAMSGYILTNARMDRIVGQLGSNTKILKILPDTIFFKFDKKVIKKLPVKLKYDLAFEKQYNLSDSIVVKPREVVASGPKTILDTIKEFETDLLHLENLSKTVNRTVSLKMNDTLSKLTFNTTRVLVNIPIDKFTEREIKVPVKVINLPSNYGIKTYPEDVTVSCLVPLTKFEKTNASLFEIVADYNESQSKRSNKLKLQVIQSPGYVRNIKLIPEKVEYIIIRK